jgi:hypothetical protein
MPYLAGTAALSVAFAVYVSIRNPASTPLIDPQQPPVYYLTHTAGSQARLAWCSAHSPLPKAYGVACESTLISATADTGVVERLAANPTLLSEGLNSCNGHSFTKGAKKNEDIACASALVARAQLAEPH